MKKHYFSRLLSALVVTFVLSIIHHQSTFADEIPDYRLQVSPSFAEIAEMKPGKTYDGVFKVQNTGAKDFEYTIEITPYGVSDINYTLDDDSETDYTIIKDWIVLSKDSGNLPSGESTEIKYTIKVPSDAPGGGQYALINVRLVQSDDEKTGASIKTANQIGFRLLTDVDGNTRRNGGVVEQNINSILFNPPIIATSLVENTGNIHLQASYILRVYPLGSSEEIYTNEDSPATVTVLPETQRFNSISWEGAPHLGVFRVEQVVSIANDTKTYSKIVFLCPIWLLFIVLLIIFCVVFWIVSRIRSRKD